MVKTTISYNVSEYAMLSEQSVFRLTVPVAEVADVYSQRQFR
ncbi:hypothetical protein ES703_19613 [subsurface metagenome]